MEIKPFYLQCLRICKLSLENTFSRIRNMYLNVSVCSLETLLPNIFLSETCNLCEIQFAWQFPIRTIIDDLVSEEPCRPVICYTSLSQVQVCVNITPKACSKMKYYNMIFAQFQWKVLKYSP